MSAEYLSDFIKGNNSKAILKVDGLTREEKYGLPNNIELSIEDVIGGDIDQSLENAGYHLDSRHMGELRRGLETISISASLEGRFNFRNDFLYINIFRLLPISSEENPYLKTEVFLSSQKLELPVRIVMAKMPDMLKPVSEEELPDLLEQLLELVVIEGKIIAFGEH